MFAKNKIVKNKTISMLVIPSRTRSFTLTFTRTPTAFRIIRIGTTITFLQLAVAGRWPKAKEVNASALGTHKLNLRSLPIRAPGPQRGSLMAKAVTSRGMSLRTLGVLIGPITVGAGNADVGAIVTEQSSFKFNQASGLGNVARGMLPNASSVGRKWEPFSFLDSLFHISSVMHFVDNKQGLHRL